MEPGFLAGVVAFAGALDAAALPDCTTTAFGFTAFFLVVERERRAGRTGLFQPTALSARKDFGIASTPAGSSVTASAAASERSARTSPITVAGRYLSGSSYGHTGYPGTSLWIDPEREMFVVLLTNRVHAARARRPAKVISDVRADLADAAALAVLDYNDTVLAMPASFRADRAVGWNRPTAAEVRRSRARRKKRPKASSTKKKKSAKPPAKKSVTQKPAAGAGAS